MSCPFPVALVRHPAPEIAPGVCYGRLDVGLSAAGQAAIAGIVEALAGFGPATIWSSPARRCSRLAAALAGGGAVRLDPRLRELDFGAWEGLAWDDVPREALDRWAAAPLDFAPPDGESGGTLLARVHAVHADLATLGGPVIVVAHGGPLKLLAALLREMVPDLLAPAPPLGSVTIIAPPEWSGQHPRR